MPTWPISLPQFPLVQGYGETRQSQVLRSQMDVGPPKVRRRFSAAIQNFSVQWHMNEAQVNTLIGFFDNDLQGGLLAFDLPHPRTAATVSARFSDVYSLVALGREQYRVSASIEILP